MIMAQLSLDEQEQCLDYRDVSHLLCLLLSSAENYALKKNPNKVFGYYDEYDNTKYKDGQGLYKQLLIEYECFRNSFSYYINKYKFYDFPENLEFEKIEKWIKKWKKDAEENAHALYDDILKILKQENTKSRFGEIKRMKKSVQIKDEEKAVSSMATNFISTNHRLNNKEKDVINEYINTQKFEFKVVLYGKPGRQFQQSQNKYQKAGFSKYCKFF